MTTPAAEETDDKLGIRSFQWIHCKLYSVLLFMTHSSLVVVIRNFLFVTVLTWFSCRITNSDNSDAARSHTNSWPCACQGSAAGKKHSLDICKIARDWHHLRLTSVCRHSVLFVTCVAFIAVHSRWRHVWTTDRHHKAVSNRILLE